AAGGARRVRRDGENLHEPERSSNGGLHLGTVRLMTMTERAHIYKSFDTELRALKHQLLSMGALVESQITDAVKAFTDRDSELAEHAIDGDRKVNQRELAIDEQCIRMLALRQPAASDLRFIAAVLKIVVDIERIGDIAVNMAERALAICDEPPLD